MRIGLTDHAVARYRERVKPAIGLEQARAELQALTNGVVPLRWHEAPEWTKARYMPNTQAVAVVSDGILLVLKGGVNCWSAVTCEVRGSMAPAIREERKVRKARRKAELAQNRKRRENRQQKALRQREQLLTRQSG